MLVGVKGRQGLIQALLYLPCEPDRWGCASGVALAGTPGPGPPEPPGCTALCCWGRTAQDLAQ